MMGTAASWRHPKDPIRGRLREWFPWGYQRAVCLVWGHHRTWSHARPQDAFCRYCGKAMP